MATNKFDDLRLFLMQEFLPLGIGIYERVKTGGANKLFETFTSSNVPINELRQEGEVYAETIRNQLDEVMPGLGNPIMAVEISVNENNEHTQNLEIKDNDLKLTLERIEENIQLINEMYNDDGTTKENQTQEN